MPHCCHRHAKFSGLVSSYRNYIGLLPHSTFRRSHFEGDDLPLSRCPLRRDAMTSGVLGRPLPSLSTLYHHLSTTAVLFVRAASDGQRASPSPFPLKKHSFVTSLQLYHLSTTAVLFCPGCVRRTKSILLSLPSEKHSPGSHPLSLPSEKHSFSDSKRTRHEHTHTRISLCLLTRQAQVWKRK